MSKAYPVGKAQKMVLDALGRQAESFQEAEQIFESLHIVVTAIRQGRTSVPQVSIAHHRMTEDESYNCELAKLIEWMDESDRAIFARPQEKPQASVLAEQDVKSERYCNLIPGQKSPEEFAVHSRFWQDIFEDYPQFTLSERSLYKKTWLEAYGRAWNAYWR